MEKNKGSGDASSTTTLKTGGTEQGLLRLHQLGLGKQFLGDLKSFLCCSQREDELLVKEEVGPGRREFLLTLEIPDFWPPEVWFSLTSLF